MKRGKERVIRLAFKMQPNSSLCSTGSQEEVDRDKISQPDSKVQTFPYNFSTQHKMEQIENIVLSKFIHFLRSQTKKELLVLVSIGHKG